MYISVNIDRNVNDKVLHLSGAGEDYIKNFLLLNLKALVFNLK